MVMARRLSVPSAACATLSQLCSLLFKFNQVLPHRPVIVAILTAVCKRWILGGAVGYVEPRDVVVVVYRVKEAGRAIVKASKQSTRRNVDKNVV